MFIRSKCTILLSRINAFWVQQPFLIFQKPTSVIQDFGIDGFYPSRSSVNNLTMYSITLIRSKQILKKKKKSRVTVMRVNYEIWTLDWNTTKSEKQLVHIKNTGGSISLEQPPTAVSALFAVCSLFWGVKYLSIVAVGPHRESLCTCATQAEHSWEPKWKHTVPLRPFWVKVMTLTTTQSQTLSASITYSIKTTHSRTDSHCSGIVCREMPGPRHSCGHQLK